MNGTTVEIDLGYALTMATNAASFAESLSTNWVFWVVAYLSFAYCFGLRKIRSEVATSLENRKNNKERSTDMPPELYGPSLFALSPAWLPFYMLWLLVSYPNGETKNPSSDEDDDEK